MYKNLVYNNFIASIFLLLMKTGIETLYPEFVCISHFYFDYRARANNITLYLSCAIQWGLSAVKITMKELNFPLYHVVYVNHLYKIHAQLIDLLQYHVYLCCHLAVRWIINNMHTRLKQYASAMNNKQRKYDYVKASIRVVIGNAVGIIVREVSNNKLILLSKSWFFIY